MRNALVGALFVALIAHPAVAQAVSLCQKGQKVRVRAGDCKKKETSIPFPLGNTDVVGTWKHRDGSALANGVFTSTFLVLSADGSGTFHEQDPTTQARLCRAFRYSAGAGTTALGMQAANASTQIVQVARSGDVLTVTDSGGTSTLDRVGTVDGSATCGTLTETARLTGLPRQHGTQGLAFTGTSFLYTAAGGGALVAVNSTTGVVLTPPDVGSIRAPYAVEGGDVWGTCFCGANNEAFRVTPSTGTLIDTVAVGTELGHEGSIRSLAVLAPGKLSLIVSESGAPAPTLLVANTAAANTLESAIAFAINVAGIGSDGTTLWGLLPGRSATVIRIDPTTGTSSGSFNVPASAVSWSGLTATADEIFLIGNAPDGTVTIATFSNPDA